MYYVDLVTSINDYAENNFPVEVVNRFIEQAEQRIYNSVQIPSLRKNVTGAVSPTNPYLACPTDWLSTFSLAAYTYASGTISTTSGSNTITYTGLNAQVGQLVTATGIPPNTYVQIVGTNSCLLTNNATATGSVTASFQGPYQYLLNKDVSFIREAFATPQYSGLPLYYSLFGPQTSNIYDMTFLLGPTPDQVYSMELHYNSYATSIIQSTIATLGTITSTGIFTAGTYYNTALTGGTGSSATATIVVNSSGVVTSVSLVDAGTGYVVGDKLSASLPFPSGTPVFTVAVASINNPTGQSWLGENFDTALLNYSLMEAITYTKGEQDLVALYQKRADDALAILKQLGDAKEKGDSYRDGAPKYKVV
jgi:hypothetical protein